AAHHARLPRHRDLLARSDAVAAAGAGDALSRKDGVPSPVAGEGGSPRSGETGEGFCPLTQLLLNSRRHTPHPALRATFSHKGRREEAPVVSAPVMAIDREMRLDRPNQSSGRDNR